jgi:hypothetical protein
MPALYPPEFRQCALELAREGKHPSACTHTIRAVRAHPGLVSAFAGSDGGWRSCGSAVSAGRARRSLRHDMRGS